MVIYMDSSVAVDIVESVFDELSLLLPLPLEPVYFLPVLFIQYGSSPLKQNSNVFMLRAHAISLSHDLMTVNRGMVDKIGIFK
ncbi:hypothetical protein CMV_010941 [Castanea mollissima]|uniref:Uncharacterized protein n=1 Tax=Castanea mollissima TaxID=60419 RepID=A0A8J4VXD0_9ROSI|nr:hypothetical protein CMV_010941 [Castanea mollissima]